MVLKCRFLARGEFGFKQIGQLICEGSNLVEDGLGLKIFVGYLELIGIPHGDSKIGLDSTQGTSRHGCLTEGKCRFHVLNSVE